jgi:hypothetical protein
MFFCHNECQEAFGEIFSATEAAAVARLESAHDVEPPLARRPRMGTCCCLAALGRCCSEQRRTQQYSAARTDCNDPERAMLIIERRESSPHPNKSICTGRPWSRPEKGGQRKPSI